MNGFPLVSLSLMLMAAMVWAQMLLPRLKIVDAILR
jgi:hypothetical protein